MSSRGYVISRPGGGVQALSFILKAVALLWLAILPDPIHPKVEVGLST